MTTPKRTAKIEAIVRNDCIKDLRERLLEAGVEGVSIDQVKGFGDYKNFFRGDLSSAHTRIEIFAHGDDIDRIVDTICQCAHSGQPGDGIVAVIPVQRLIHSC